MFIKQVFATSLESIYAPGAAMGGDSANVSKLVSPLIANILIFSGLAAFFVILLSGFNYVTSNGDKAKVEQSQQMLNYGILGIIVVVTAFAITRIIGTLIGFKFF